MIVSDRLVIFGKGGHELNLINVETGELVRTFRGASPTYIANATLTPDRKQIVITTDNNAVVSVVDIATGNTLRTLPPANDRVPGLAVQRDSGILATGSHDSFVRLYDPADFSRPLTEIDHQGLVDGLAFSTSGKLLATVQRSSQLNSNESIVKVYRIPQLLSGPDANAMIYSEKPWLPHEASVSADGQYFATPGARWQPGPRSAQVYDTRTMLPISSEIALNAELTATAMSPSGDSLITLTSAVGTPLRDQNGKTGEYMSQRGLARLWDWKTGQQIGSMETESIPLDATFSPDGKWLCIICGRGHVLVLESKTMQVKASMVHEGSAVYGFERRRRMIRFPSSGDQFCTLGIGSSVCLWNIDGTLKAKLPTKGYVYDAQYSPDGEHLATATDSGTVTIWNIQTGEPAAESLPHSAQVWQVNFDTSGQRLVTACEDRMARVWDWRKGKLVGPGLEHESAVRFADFVSDGDFLVTGSQKTLRCWDLKNGREIAPPRPHDLRPEAFLLADNQQLVIGPGAAFWLSEFDEPPAETLPAGSIKLAAESVSARRIERNGTVSLSNEEWRDTFRHLRDVGETPYELLGGTIDQGVIQLEKRLRPLWQSGQWRAAVEVLKSVSSEELNDCRLLVLATEACIQAGEFSTAQRWMNRLTEVVRQTEDANTNYISLSTALRHPKLQVEYRQLLTALCEHTNPDQRLIALACLGRTSVIDTSHADLAILLLIDSDTTVHSAVRRFLEKQLADDRTGRWMKVLNELPEETRSLFDESLKLATERVIEEPAILALLGQSDEWEWSVPEPLKGDVNVPGEDHVAFVSADGNRMYFASNREGGLGKRDLWLAVRDLNTGEFHVDRHLGDVVNSSAIDTEITLTGDELTAFFSSNRRGNRDLWFATRDALDQPFRNATQLGPEINTSSFNTGPLLANDGLRLLSLSFVNGSFDLQMASRQSVREEFIPASPLSAEINSTAREGGATIALDGKYLLYHSGFDSYASDLYLSIWSDEQETYVGKYRLAEQFQSEQIDCAPVIDMKNGVLYFASSRPGSPNASHPYGWDSMEIWTSRLVKRDKSQQNLP